MSNIDFFSYVENDLPGAIPQAPKINDDRVRGQGTVSQVLGRTREDALKYLTDIFVRNGMPASLAKWAYDTIVEGASGTELAQRMYNRPEFRERMKPIFELQRLYPGMPAISPQDVLEYERRGADLMRSAGFPPQFYDHYTDFQPLMIGRVSMDELASRINDGFARVAQGPRAVRDAFANMFGPSGDSALAATYLDPAKAWPALRMQAQAAGVAGAGFNFGFTLGKDRAMEAAAAGYDFDSSADRWASLLQSRPLFTETINEDTDLQAEDQGVATVFGLQGAGEAGTALERRRQERTAAFGGGGGAAGSTAAGARGLASAE